MLFDRLIRGGRPGQDELAWLAAIIDRPTDMIPKAWLDLPLVQ
jgi:hypothetical protein